LPLKWEFPGGKINDGEHPEECLSRELHEELGIGVVISRPLAPVTYQYSTFIITLYPFVCRITTGEIILHEHKALTWLSPERLHALDWADADMPVIDNYRNTLQSYLRDNL